MKRRTVLKRVGIASAGAVGATGNVAARRAPVDGVVGELDVTVDVSDVTGEVALADVLSDEQLADLDVDVSGVRLAVDADVDEVTPSTHECCRRCCEEDFPDCDSSCSCCVCDDCTVT